MSAGKSKSRWTRAEIETARLFGTERIPNNGFGQPDFIVPASSTRGPIAVQVKTKAALPAWFSDAMSQATLDAGNTDPEAIAAVVIVHAPGSGIKKKRYAVLRLEDAARLLGDLT